MKKEYLQPIIEIEIYEDVVLCDQTVNWVPSNNIVPDDAPDEEF